MTDVNYKKALLQGMGENPDEYDKLSSIVGKQELIDFLIEHEHTPEIYTPMDDFANVRNKKFQANFHIHTTNSDGLMTVEKLLELGARYGDSIAKINPDKKFYLAITDHNTINGAKEALKLVFENPEKYKNLKIVLGVEASAMFHSDNADKTSEVHLLSYCLNPFKDTIAQINQKRLKIFQYNIKNALNNANIRYYDIIEKYGFEFNFEDMAKIRPSIKTCPSNVRYSAKDYMQFRLLYASLVDNNYALKHYLALNGVYIDQLDFSIPKTMITENKYPQYWQNYVEQLQIYLTETTISKNKFANTEKLQNLYGNIDEDLLNVLTSLEHSTLDSSSDMYIKEPTPLSFEEVIDSFKMSQSSISGIAHGGCYEKNNPQRKIFLHELYGQFKTMMDTPVVVGETYYPYKNMEDAKEAQNFITLFKYLRTGGQDSHKNNFFTPQAVLNANTINELIDGKKDEIQQTIVRQKLSGTQR